MSWPVVVLAMLTAFMVGLYFGYEFTMRRAQEWIVDHMASHHRDPLSSKGDTT